MNKSFDSNVDQYSKIITEGARASGETYEYFVELRMALFIKATAQELSRELPSSILDFGCGNGYTVEQLSRRFPNARLYGFDTSGESIIHAINRNISGACFNYGEEYKLPYANNSFDAIYSNGTFHHIVPRERVTWMKELYRVLKKERVIVIFENNPLNPLMMQAMRRTPFDRDADPIRAGKLSAIVKGAGFHSCAIRYYFFFPHALKWLRSVEPLLRSVPFGAQYFVTVYKY